MPEIVDGKRCVPCHREIGEPRRMPPLHMLDTSCGPAMCRDGVTPVGQSADGQSVKVADLLGALIRNG